MARWTRRSASARARARRCMRLRFIRPARRFTSGATSPVSRVPAAVTWCACCRMGPSIRPSTPARISTVRCARFGFNPTARCWSVACSPPLVLRPATSSRDSIQTARSTRSTSAPVPTITSPALKSNPMAMWSRSATSPATTAFPAITSCGSTARTAPLIRRSTSGSARTI